MKIFDAIFIQSSPDPKQTPTPIKPAYAFIGRSNVGKSSLINMLTNRKNLAKTSSTPGKTQLINYFLINKSWYLIDLPGYGWAKVSKGRRADFQKIIARYLLSSFMLVSTFVLIDSRHPPQTSDITFINWLGQNNLPFAIVFTKIDKTSKDQAQRNLAAFQKILLQNWEKLPPYFITSAKHYIGSTPLLEYIHKHLPSH